MKNAFIIAVAYLLLSLSTAIGQEERWPAPKIDDQNFNQWLEFIQPGEKELRWQKIRWHKELADAAKEARELQRPILLFSMNGNPCGET